MALAEATTDYNIPIRTNPGDAAAYFKRSQAFILVHQNKHALGDLFEAIRLAPANPDYYYARAYAAHRMHNDRLAVADYTRVLELIREGQQRPGGRRTERARPDL